MKKKIFSALLALIMMMSIIPTVSFADGGERFTGIDIRFQDIVDGQTPATTQLTATGALYTDEDNIPHGFVRTDSLSVDATWYELKLSLNAIDTNELNGFVEFTNFGNAGLNRMVYIDDNDIVYLYENECESVGVASLYEIHTYVKQLSASDAFRTNRYYMAQVTITAQKQSEFLSGAKLSGLDVLMLENTGGVMTACAFATASASAKSISSLSASVASYDYYGNRVELSLPEAPVGYKYWYRTLTGVSDSLSFATVTGTPAGSIMTDRTDGVWAQASDNNIFFNPTKGIYVQFILASQYEQHWAFQPYAYGTIVTPISCGVINVNDLHAFKNMDVVGLTDITFGAMPSEVTQVTFNGAFANEECSLPMSEDSDIYLSFTVSHSGGFWRNLAAINQDINDDFGDIYYLTDGVHKLESYSTTSMSSTEDAVLFKYSKENIFASIRCSGGIGNESVGFLVQSGANFTSVPSLIVEPIDGTLSATICASYDEQVYIADVKINGESVGTVLASGNNYELELNQYKSTRISFTESVDTDIEIIFKECDIVTIDTDGLTTRTPSGSTPTYFHASNVYYVGETGEYSLGWAARYGGPNISVEYPDGARDIALCVYAYNTQKDGKGISIELKDEYGNFIWYPTLNNLNAMHSASSASLYTTYVNGQKDNITLYPQLRCEFHAYNDITGNKVDNGEPADLWIYHEAEASSCGHAGHVAYRECKYCGAIEIATDAANAFEGYRHAVYNDVFTDYMPHDYHATSNGDGTHTLTCSRCQDSKTEDCTFGNYTDNGDGTHSHTCSVCGGTVTEKHHYENGLCTECGNDEPTPAYIQGDMDGDGEVTAADAEYLLYYTIFGEEDYPINQPADFTNDGSIDAADAEYLLYYTIFGEEDYPLNASDDVVLPYVPLP